MKVILISGKARCVDSETEFFNGEGWKSVSEYEEGEKVLQFNEGKAELVVPSEYFHENCEGMWQFKNSEYEFLFTEDHDIVYTLSKYNFKRFYKKSAKEIVSLYSNNVGGFTGIIPATFDWNGPGIGLTDEQIRLKIAIYADGSFVKMKQNCYLNCSFNLKKERKIERLKKLLEQNHIDYSCYSCANGFVKFYFHVDKPEKHFGKEWYNCSREQLKVVAEEIMYWDGCAAKQGFYTTNKEDADFVQFVWSACGNRTSIKIDDRVGKSQGNYIRKSVTYSVLKSDCRGYGLHKRRKTDKLCMYRPDIKDCYCFTVPSGMLILRRKNNIFVTGNCGKDSFGEALKRQLETKGKKVFNTHYADFLKFYCARYKNWDGQKNFYGRQLLQETGSVARNNYEDAWVDIVISLLRGFKSEYDYAIIPDTRYPNEIEHVKAVNSSLRLYNQEFAEEIHTIRVSRPGFENDLTPEQKQHPSETALDDYEFDYYYANVGDLKKMEEDALRWIEEYFAEK